MKKQMKVIAMLIIAVAVMLGCSIGSPVKWKAQAAETVVPEGYEPISSADQLNGIRNNLSGKYILTEDIDLTEYTKEGGIFDTGNGWTPIDNFTGTFDGNGHRIIGMHIYGKIDTVGLFGTVSGATIKNLSLTDVDIEMNTNYGDYTGALVGTCGNNTQISGIYVDGLISVSDGGACLGGIIGRIWNAEQNIVQNCINNCSVSNSYSGYLGGIVGRSYSGYANSVTNCYTRGNLQQADDGYYKPIMGSYNYNDEIKNCYYDPKSLMESKRNTQYNNCLLYTSPSPRDA